MRPDDFYFDWITTKDKLLVVLWSGTSLCKAKQSEKVAIAPRFTIDHSKVVAFI